MVQRERPSVLSLILLLGAFAFGTACGPAGSNSMDGGWDAPPPRDVRPIEVTPPPPGPLGCRGVDILFLVDNSPSMRPKQQRLAEAFPRFVDAMFQQLPQGTDLHVGITTTSFYVGDTGEGFQACRTTATPDYIQSRYMTPLMMNTGENGGQGRLFRYDNRNFFSTNTTTGDRDALRQWFTAAATGVGEESSSVECSSAGIGYAAHASNASTNAGFIRDQGSVLVIIALTDEPDKSPEAASVYHDLIVESKRGCGGDRCVITAGIVPPCMREVNDPLWRFLNSFGREPTYGDIEGTSEQYTQVVGDALARLIRDTCASIPPPP